MPPFIGLGRVVAGGMRRADELDAERQQERDARESKRMRDIQMAALLAGLDAKPESQATLRTELPDVSRIGESPSMRRPGQEVDTGIPDPDYVRAGGYAIPTASSRQRAEQIVAQRQREQVVNRRVALVMARNPGISREQAMAYAESDDAFEGAVKPQEPKAATGTWDSRRGMFVYPDGRSVRPSGVQPIPEPAAGPADEERFKRSAQLQTAFRQEKVIGEAREIADQAASIRGLRDGSPMGAADIAIVIGFNKVLDPGAIVREGDVALARSAAGLKQRLETFIANAKEGQVMDPKLRAEMIDVAQRVAATKLAAARRVYEAHRKNAEKYGADPDMVTMGAEFVVPSPDAAAADDFTEAELAAAWRAGKREDEEIANYIRAMRGGR